MLQVYLNAVTLIDMGEWLAFQLWCEAVFVSKELL